MVNLLSKTGLIIKILSEFCLLWAFLFVWLAFSPCELLKINFAPVNAASLSKCQPLLQSGLLPHLPYTSIFTLLFPLFSCFQGSACSCVFCRLLILSSMVFLTNENISADVVAFCNLVSGNRLFFPCLSPHWKYDSQLWFLPDCKLIKNERFQKASKFAYLGKTIPALLLATLKLHN